MVRYSRERRQPGGRIHTESGGDVRIGNTSRGSALERMIPPGGTHELSASAASDRSTMGTHEHHQLSGHAHTGHGAGHGTTSWATAAQATLHCLTGCAIGEVLGMVIGTAAGFHNAGTVVLSIVLAFVFGYALTMRGASCDRACRSRRRSRSPSQPTPSRSPSWRSSTTPSSSRSRRDGRAARPVAVLGLPGTVPRTRVRGHHAGEPMDDQSRPRPRCRPRQPLNNPAVRLHVLSYRTTQVRATRLSGRRDRGQGRTRAHHGEQHHATQRHERPEHRHHLGADRAPHAPRNRRGPVAGLDEISGGTWQRSR